GSYTISSLSTLINALFASGGPSKNGSMRQISLKRQGKEIASFDFYDLIVRGDKSKDLRLLPGDVIYVAPVGRLVALAGSVNVPVPGGYPWREGMRVKDLIPSRGFLITDEFWKRQNKLGIDPDGNSFKLREEREREPQASSPANPPGTQVQNAGQPSNPQNSG